jgi:hypothetical protein
VAEDYFFAGSSRMPMLFFNADLLKKTLFPAFYNLPVELTYAILARRDNFY